MKARPRVQGRPIAGRLVDRLNDRGGVLLGTPPSTPTTPSRRRRVVLLVLKLVLVVQLAMFLIVRWRAAAPDGEAAGGVSGSSTGARPVPLSDSEEEERNSQLLQRRREKIRDECRGGGGPHRLGRGPVQSNTALRWRSELDRAAGTVLAGGGGTPANAAASSSSLPATGPSNETERCRFTFFDFGANVGDSLGKFISVGIPSCDDGEDINGTEALDPLVSVASSSSSSSFAGHTARGNRLVRWSKKIMAELGQQLEGRTLQPEHYCYVGIEGNPVFTSRLRQLQEQIVRVEPRPVKWAHFYTETVGAISNDPTVLYLDTKNADKNYWGSSTLYTHRDVQASANAEGQVYQAQVQGVTLTTLLRRHVLSDHGSHVLIKLDIEGSEYAVLNEAAESGILCELSAQAVQIDVMVEVHSKQVIGALDEMEYFRHAVKSNLERLCGVNLHLTMEAD